MHTRAVLHGFFGGRARQVRTDLSREGGDLRLDLVIQLGKYYEAGAATIPQRSGGVRSGGREECEGVGEHRIARETHRERQRVRHNIETTVRFSQPGLGRPGQQK